MNRKRLRLGDLSVGFVYALANAVRTKGHDPQALMLRFGIDNSTFATPNARLSIPRYMRLGHAAIQLTQEPALGLAIGQQSLPVYLGLAGIASLHAPTLGEAARTLLDYEPLYGSNYRGQSRFERQESHAWLHFYSISPYNDYNRFVIDQVLSGWICMLSHITGKPITPERVLIEYPRPATTAPYEALFGCAVEFGAETNALLLDAETLALPGLSYFPGTWKSLLDICKTELLHLTRLHSLTERIVAMLGPLLKNGEPSLEEIARRLQMPAWTLRRKLADEGTRYLDILNDTRRELAISYIRDTDLSFGEVAYVLGFASAAAFQRAFKRWTLLTPGDFRKAIRKEG
ncbi:AraC family transcriptional regulator [Pseudomonas asuensis]|uniref:Transcriptional regulator n=1 Tax=Pseudomonas asuensis TaxID=1825787 RepID=A0ABQ2GR82_9PSED|nr:AraC family transcriptional regulator [Pseudomonas asuensis]GGM07667.1 transcriptional regulator [Pseudomonas asuensis]